MADDDAKPDKSVSSTSNPSKKRTASLFESIAALSTSSHETVTKKSERGLFDLFQNEKKNEKDNEAETSSSHNEESSDRKAALKSTFDFSKLRRLKKSDEKTSPKKESPKKDVIELSSDTSDLDRSFDYSLQTLKIQTNSSESEREEIKNEKRDDVILLSSDTGKDSVADVSSDDVTELTPGKNDVIGESPDVKCDVSDANGKETCKDDKTSDLQSVSKPGGDTGRSDDRDLKKKSYLELKLNASKFTLKDQDEDEYDVIDLGAPTMISDEDEKRVLDSTCDVNSRSDDVIKKRDDESESDVLPDLSPRRLRNRAGSSSEFDRSNASTPKLDHSGKTDSGPKKILMREISMGKGSYKEFLVEVSNSVGTVWPHLGSLSKKALCIKRCHASMELPKRETCPARVTRQSSKPPEYILKQQWSDNTEVFNPLDHVGKFDVVPKPDDFKESIFDQIEKKTSKKGVEKKQRGTRGLAPEVKKKKARASLKSYYQRKKREELEKKYGVELKKVVSEPAAKMLRTKKLNKLKGEKRLWRDKELAVGRLAEVSSHLGPQLGPLYPAICESCIVLRHNSSISLDHNYSRRHMKKCSPSYFSGRAEPCVYCTRRDTILPSAGGSSSQSAHSLGNIIKLDLDADSTQPATFDRKPTMLFPKTTVAQKSTPAQKSTIIARPRVRTDLEIGSNEAADVAEERVQMVDPLKTGFHMRAYALGIPKQKCKKLEPLHSDILNVGLMPPELQNPETDLPGFSVRLAKVDNALEIVGAIIESDTDHMNLSYVLNLDDCSDAKANRVVKGSCRSCFEHEKKVKKEAKQKARLREKVDLSLHLGDLIHQISKNTKCRPKKPSNETTFNRMREVDIEPVHTSRLHVAGLKQGVAGDRSAEDKPESPKSPEESFMSNLGLKKSDTDVDAAEEWVNRIASNFEESSRLEQKSSLDLRSNDENQDFDYSVGKIWKRSGPKMGDTADANSSVSEPCVMAQPDSENSAEQKRMVSLLDKLRNRLTTTQNAPSSEDPEKSETSSSSSELENDESSHNSSRKLKSKADEGVESSSLSNDESMDSDGQALTIDESPLVPSKVESVVKTPATEGDVSIAKQQDQQMEVAPSPLVKKMSGISSIIDRLKDKLEPTLSTSKLTEEPSVESVELGNGKHQGSASKSTETFVSQNVQLSSARFPSPSNPAKRTGITSIIDQLRDRLDTDPAEKAGVESESESEAPQDTTLSTSDDDDSGSLPYASIMKSMSTSEPEAGEKTNEIPDAKSYAEEEKPVDDVSDTDRKEKVLEDIVTESCQVVKANLRTEGRKEGTNSGEGGSDVNLEIEEKREEAEEVMDVGHKDGEKVREPIVSEINTDLPVKTDVPMSDAMRDEIDQKNLDKDQEKETGKERNTNIRESIEIVRSRTAEVANEFNGTSQRAFVRSKMPVIALTTKEECADEDDKGLLNERSDLDVGTGEDAVSKTADQTEIADVDLEMEESVFLRNAVNYLEGLQVGFEETIAEKQQQEFFESQAIDSVRELKYSFNNWNNVTPDYYDVKLASKRLCSDCQPSIVVRKDWKVPRNRLQKKCAAQLEKKTLQAEVACNTVPTKVIISHPGPRINGVPLGTIRHPSPDNTSPKVTVLSSANLWKQGLLKARKVLQGKPNILSRSPLKSEVKPSLDFKSILKNNEASKLKRTESVTPNVATAVAMNAFAVPDTAQQADSLVSTPSGAKLIGPRGVFWNNGQQLFFVPTAQQPAVQTNPAQAIPVSVRLHGTTPTLVLQSSNSQPLSQPMPAIPFQHLMKSSQSSTTPILSSIQNDVAMPTLQLANRDAVPPSASTSPQTNPGPRLPAPSVPNVLTAAGNAPLKGNSQNTPLLYPGATLRLPDGSTIQAKNVRLITPDGRRNELRSARGKPNQISFPNQTVQVPPNARVLKVSSLPTPSGILTSVKPLGTPVNNPNAPVEASSSGYSSLIFPNPPAVPVGAAVKAPSSGYTSLTLSNTSPGLQSFITSGGDRYQVSAVQSDPASTQLLQKVHLDPEEQFNFGSSSNALGLRIESVVGSAEMPGEISNVAEELKREDQNDQESQNQNRVSVEESVMDNVPPRNDSDGDDPALTSGHDSDPNDVGFDDHDNDNDDWQPTIDSTISAKTVPLRELRTSEPSSSISWNLSQNKVLPIPEEYKNEMLEEKRKIDELKKKREEHERLFANTARASGKLPDRNNALCKLFDSKYSNSSGVIDWEKVRKQVAHKEVIEKVNKELLYDKSSGADKADELWDQMIKETTPVKDSEIAMPVKDSEITMPVKDRDKVSRHNALCKLIDSKYSDSSGVIDWEKVRKQVAHKEVIEKVIKELLYDKSSGADKTDELWDQMIKETTPVKDSEIAMPVKDSEITMPMKDRDKVSRPVKRRKKTRPVEEPTTPVNEEEDGAQPTAEDVFAALMRMEPAPASTCSVYPRNALFESIKEEVSEGARSSSPESVSFRHVSEPENEDNEPPPLQIKIQKKTVPIEKFFRHTMWERKYMCMDNKYKPNSPVPQPDLALKAASVEESAPLEKRNRKRRADPLRFLSEEAKREVIETFCGHLDAVLDDVANEKFEISDIASIFSNDSEDIWSASSPLETSLEPRRRRGEGYIETEENHDHDEVADENLIFSSLEVQPGQHNDAEETYEEKFNISTDVEKQEECESTTDAERSSRRRSPRISEQARPRDSVFDFLNCESEMANMDSKRRYFNRDTSESELSVPAETEVECLGRRRSPRINKTVTKEPPPKRKKTKKRTLSTKEPDTAKKGDSEEESQIRETRLKKKRLATKPKSISQPAVLKLECQEDIEGIDEMSTDIAESTDAVHGPPTEPIRNDSPQNVENELSVPPIRIKSEPVDYHEDDDTIQENGAEAVPDSDVAPMQLGNDSVPAISRAIKQEMLDSPISGVEAGMSQLPGIKLTIKKEWLKLSEDDSSERRKRKKKHHHHSNRKHHRRKRSRTDNDPEVTSHEGHTVDLDANIDSVNPPTGSSEVTLSEISFIASPESNRQNLPSAETEKSVRNETGKIKIPDLGTSDLGIDTGFKATNPIENRPVESWNSLKTPKHTMRTSPLFMEECGNTELFSDDNSSEDESKLVVSRILESNNLDSDGDDSKTCGLSFPKPTEVVKNTASYLTVGSKNPLQNIDFSKGSGTSGHDDDDIVSLEEASLLLQQVGLLNEVPSLP